MIELRFLMFANQALDKIGVEVGRAFRRRIEERLAQRLIERASEPRVERDAEPRLRARVDLRRDKVGAGFAQDVLAALAF